MNRYVLHYSGVAAVVLAAAMTASAAPAPQAQPSPAQPAPQHQEHHWPPPKNLQVLPKTLSTEQVHEIMHKWAGELGAKCSTCHAVDPKRVGPNGRPELDFASDAKAEKRTARLMYKMTQNINENYISMVENSGQPVTCGTCHRGHVTPEPFLPPPDHDHDHHPAPAPAAQPK